MDIAIIQGIDTDADKQQFLRALIDYAHLRGVQVLAEGVETLSELRKVLEMGVDLLQGYCLAPPAAEPGASTKRPPRSLPRWSARKPSGKKPGLKKQKVSPSVLVICTRFSGHWLKNE